MIQISLSTLQAISRGVKPINKVKVYFQTPETYTDDDYLAGVGDLSVSMSSEGSYEIANTTITLKNKDYYFSRRLNKELPNNKLVEIFMNISGEEILIFRGIIPNEGGWTLTKELLTLNINA